MQTLYLDGQEPSDLDKAAQLLQAGKLVALPTETVYGLSACMNQPEAIARVYEVKERDSARALAVLVPSFDAAKAMWLDGPWIEAAQTLAEHFWPGPLTIICPAQAAIDTTLRGGSLNMGARCPDHPVALAILERTGIPLATPSANVSGMPSATSASSVKDQLDGKISAIVDGGACPGGLESTIVSLTADGAHLERAGALSVDIIDATLPPAWSLGSSQSDTGRHQRLIPGLAANPLSIEICVQGSWQVLERDSVDDLVRDLHNMLRPLSRGDRSGAAWRAGESVREDPRFLGICYLMNRYLRHT